MVSVGNVLIFTFSNIIYMILPSAATIYNVLNYGAKPGYVEEDSTAAFISTWNSACGSSTRATLYAPSGRYLLNKTISFQGPCKNNKLTVKIDGTLVAPLDYNVIGSNGY